MVAANFYAESQAQFSESQKKFADLWEASQKELVESQKKLSDKWVGSLPKQPAMPDFAGDFEKALGFQQDLVNSVLEAQQVTLRLTLQTQKQFWEDYFQMTRKMMQNTESS
jgi:soluble cytochrome b562